MTAFITRDLSEASEFKKMLAAAGWQAEGRSLVELSPLPFREIPAADWIFFSSKNAVRFFFEHIESGGDSKSPPDFAHTKWAALGLATAKELEEYVDKVDFTGTGEPKSTAEAFRRANPVLPPSEGPTHPADGGRVRLRILFPAARHSRQSVMSLLSPDFQCIHYPIYDNRPVADPPHSDAGVLVFTSPLNAEAYFSKNRLEKHQRVVAIGETTAGALGELGISDITVAKEATERGLAEATLRLRR